MSTDYCRYRPDIVENSRDYQLQKDFFKRSASLNNLMFNRRVTKSYKLHFGSENTHLTEPSPSPRRTSVCDARHINPTGFRDKGKTPPLPVTARHTENG